jgi:O-methyltransferase involved in polyketide biosynthesis
MVVWSGVMPYLEPAAVDTTLRWMASQAGGSCLVFDYCWEEVVDGSSVNPDAVRVRRAAELRGEPWFSGIPRGGVEEFLAQRGLGMVEEVDTSTARERYLRRADGSVVGTAWDFGGFVRARVPHTP